MTHAAEVEVPDVSQEQLLRDKFACLERLTEQVHAVIGPARNYVGFTQPELVLPVDEEARLAQQVRP